MIGKMKRREGIEFMQSRVGFSDNEMQSRVGFSGYGMEYSDEDVPVARTKATSKDIFDYCLEHVEPGEIKKSKSSAQKHKTKANSGNVQQPNITSSTAKGAVDKRQLHIREPLLFICGVLISILVYYGFGWTNTPTSANIHREGFLTQRIDALDRGILEIKRQHELDTTRFTEFLSTYQSENTDEDETRIKKIHDEVQKQLSGIKAAKEEADRIVLHIKNGEDTIYLDMFYKGVAVVVVYTVLLLSIILFLCTWNRRLQNRLKVIENIMKINSSGQVPGRT